MLRYKRWTFEAWYESECTNIPSLAPLVTRHTQKTRIPHEINIRSKGLVFFKINTSLVTQPMHASFLFYHSNLRLAYTTQACILNWNFSNASKHMIMYIQMHHTSSWACSPYLCAQILIDPLPLSYLSLYIKVLPFVIFSLSLCAISLPLSSMTTKV